MRLPTFSNINFSQIEAQLDNLLSENRRRVDELCTQTSFTWVNLIYELEILSLKLSEFLAPIHYLNAVVKSDESAATIEKCLPKITDYEIQLSQNARLYAAINAIRNSAEYETLSAAQQKVVANLLLDFKLSGFGLSVEKMQRVTELQKELSVLRSKFSNNVTDSVGAFKKHIADENELQGIPESTKTQARNAAAKKGLDGFLFSLTGPDVQAILDYADSRELRREIYHAYITRASDIFPSGNQFDNTQFTIDILKKRHELATLLGFQNYAQYSLVTKMAKSTDEVLSFLNELALKSREIATKEFRELAAFARDELKIDDIQPWDINYATEKLCQHRYAFSSEDLRPYFPEDCVLKGLFDVMHLLYGIKLKKFEADVWHKDASCYRITNQAEEVIGHIYFDLYARDKKRGGAWMKGAVNRCRFENADLQLPVAFVTCNFNGPNNDQPALFDHDDVVTLFHECGHALQHLLTQVDIPSVSGTSGIPWDAVEIASQFFENWAWNKSSIEHFGKHVESNEPIPPILYEKLLRAKNFQSAMQMMRQMEFALMDFCLHTYEFTSTTDHKNVLEIVKQVRQQCRVTPLYEQDRFLNSYQHIFSAGYAAGYYSYSWANVMACDLFSSFEKQGIFNKDLSKNFKELFLETGGVVDPMDQCVAFLGRKPSVDALLSSSGIIPPVSTAQLLQQIGLSAHRREREQKEASTLTLKSA